MIRSSSKGYVYLFEQPQSRSADYCEIDCSIRPRSLPPPSLFRPSLTKNALCNVPSDKLCIDTTRSAPTAFAAHFWDAETSNLASFFLSSQIHRSEVILKKVIVLMPVLIFPYMSNCSSGLRTGPPEQICRIQAPCTQLEKFTRFSMPSLIHSIDKGLVLKYLMRETKTLVLRYREPSQTFPHTQLKYLYVYQF